MLVITGASGQLGRAATQTVLKRNDPRQLILTTRTPEAIEDVPDGVQVRYANFDEPESLAKAFAGGRRLLLVSTGTLTNRSAQHAAAIDAAIAAGVQHVLYTSMTGAAQENPALISESHWATEEHLRASGLGWTMLRCGMYSDFLVFEAAEALRTGRLVHNRGDGRCGYVARLDCAKAAAAALTSEGLAGAVYDITGPESLNADELAQLYGVAGGRSVTTEQVDDDALLKLRGGGPDADPGVQFGAELGVSIGKAIREGRLNVSSTAVADLTGDAPTDVRTMLERQRDKLRSG